MFQIYHSYCCSTWLVFELKTYAEKRVNTKTEFRHLLFKLVFLLLGEYPEVFLKFHYLIVNINTFSCNLNLRYSENLFSYSYEGMQFVKPYSICVFFFSCFFFFHQESLHKNQRIYFSSWMQIEFRSDEIPQGMFQGQHLVHEFQQAWIQRPTDKCNQLIVREIMAGF